MPIVNRPVKRVFVDYKCDECGKGFLRPTGKTTRIEPGMYEHQCANCGVIVNVKGATFPRLMEVPEDE